ncbi:MAG: glycoside hydrolase family protein [Alphaproteobacteria bacterium]|jgi:lysozyme|nr:glycoside hydrolase family protein [Alphaproteobacteria bacterium]
MKLSKKNLLKASVSSAIAISFIYGSKAVYEKYFKIERINLTTEILRAYNADKIKHCEEFRSNVYMCYKKAPTIGYGTKLPLTKEEMEIININTKNPKKIKKAQAEMLLFKRLNDSKRYLSKYSFYKNAPDSVKMALTDMCYNMGIGSLLTFKNMIRCIKSKDFDQASKECMNSNYGRELTTRALSNSLLIKRACSFNELLNQAPKIERPDIKGINKIDFPLDVCINNLY